MEPVDFDKWKGKAERLFAQGDRLRVRPPGRSLIDTLEYIDHVNAVLDRIDQSDDCRLIILEAWLIIDHTISHLLRDGLNMPERIDSALNVLPRSFEKKLELIKILRKVEAGKLPNQESYTAYHLHPEFSTELLNDDEDLFKRLLERACRFQEKHCPHEAIVILGCDFEQTRFVPEPWYERVSQLDKSWFQRCKQLNKARNLAAHMLKINENKLFRDFDASCLGTFKGAIKAMIEQILFESA